MSENGLGMIMFLLYYVFFSIGADEMEVKGREGEEKDIRRNSSAASVAPCCICGQAVSLQLQNMCVCVCIVLVTACQTVHSLCGKANMKETVG